MNFQLTNEIYSDGFEGSFEDLQSEIDNAPEGSVLKLDRNYSGNRNGVDLNKNLTIDGQGHTLDCVGQHGAFYSYSGTITLKNLNIINGLSHGEGGAIYMRYNAKYTIENCVFKNNKARTGGAIYFETSNPLTIINCTFIDNSIPDDFGNPSVGGAISSTTSFTYKVLNLYVNNCTFKGNTVEEKGGAIYCLHDVEVHNCLFESNQAKGSSSECKGGAIYCGGELILQNSEFKNNCVEDYGGAIYAETIKGTVSDSIFINNKADDDGGAIYINNDCTPRFYNCLFEKNSCSGFGGAIYAQSFSSEVNMEQCSFIENSATEDGGAICCMHNAVVTNCLFESNQAKSAAVYLCRGGAIYCYRELTLKSSEFKNNFADEYGGAIYTGTVKGTISDSVFINNRADDDDGGAIYINNKCDPKFYNCSFEKNSCGDEGGAIYVDSGASEVNMEHCSFIENSAGEDGGAICCMNNAVVTNCLFDSNQAKGSSEQCEGGAIFCDDELTLKNSVFKNNCAEDYGGAVYTGTVKDSISDSVFINNKVEKDDGGAIFIDDECNPGFYACLFEKNSCGDEGGAIYIDDSDSQVSIEHCSFSDNSASEDNGQSVYNCGDYTTVNRCWHGTNSPDFTDQFKIWHSVASDEDYIPGEYAVICMKLNDTTFYMGTPYDVSVYFCLNTNPDEVLSDIPFNELIYSGDGNFSNPDNHHELTKKVTFTKEDATINAALNYQTLSLNVKVVPSVIIADNIKRGVNSPYDYYATLIYADGKPIMGRQITFTIDSKEYKAISDADGIAKVSAGLTLVNDKETVYDVVVTNPDTLENVTATTTIVPRLIVVPGDLTADYLSNPPYVVQAIGDDGNPVGENETVNVVFAGFSYDLKTDAAGHVVRTIGLAPGIYAVKACYKGYNTTSTLFMVSQVLKVTSGTIKKTAKSYTLKATLKSSNGKALANKEVILSFKGKTYKVFTNSKGVASKKITASVIKTLKAGKTYTLQARYVNDIAKGKIKVVK